MLRVPLALVLTLAARPAGAGGIALAVDAGYAASADPAGTGVAAALRGGYQADLAILHVTPGAGYRYVQSGIGTWTGPFGELRIGLGAFLVPSVYAQYGLALPSTTTCTLGAALDLTAIPKILVGLHADSTSDCGDYRVYAVGGHAGVTF